MAVLAGLLRIFSYLFHLLLSLFFTGLGLVALISDLHNLQLTMTPWSGKELTYSLIVIGLFGLLSVLLAMAGRMRVMFLLYALGIFVMLFRGFFLTLYSFTSGPVGWENALWLTGAAFLAAIGAMTGLRKKRDRLGS